ncbi:MAG TPA: flagellar basal body L-ring protein FlgH [Spirochaetota bacterium]|nr:flagellar basal body L-ring protein FlgH [Spirochaetota bacterium]HOT20505.1 flagellar basal body L-ring protein FlgH [Spirochaetota bacterium]HPD05961.1 flagellar basal body L-ring protein FlgH [Spirochaetota bacterium]HPK44916.1 flagellar basal body L-ring protein FlgH [Spirochaetota bacterium]HQG42812.1 flagellar basal body L-ring protein FlgH [Spirochaetota bacterium]
MKKIFVAIALVIASSVYADTIWKDKNLYTAQDAIKVGDIFTIIVTDISQMRFTLTLANNDAFTVTSAPDGTITPFLPQINASRHATKNNTTNLQHRGNIAISIAATVQERLANGNFRVNGTKTFSFSGVTTIFNVSGIVNPASIKGGTINSSDIANLVLQIQGVKESVRITRAPLKEGESASYTLTEQEKQQIIIQYLQRILGELTQ